MRASDRRTVPLAMTRGQYDAYCDEHGHTPMWKPQHSHGMASFTVAPAEGSFLPAEALFTGDGLSFNR